MNDLKAKKTSIAVFFELLICIFYLWYFMPVVNATFSAGFYKYIFFGCYFGGMTGLFLLNGFKLNKITVAVILYFFVLVVLYLLKIGDAHKHIRVSFTFWGTALLYFGLLNDDGRIRIGKFLIAIYVITCITSIIGVTLDNRAARTIASASAEGVLKRKHRLHNIANIYLFQGMVLLIPSLVAIIEQKIHVMLCNILLLVMPVILINASFTISIFVYIFAIIVTFGFKNSKNKYGILLVCMGVILILLLAFKLDDILFLISRMIDNPKVSERIEDLRLLLLNQDGGTAELRAKLYSASFKTFLTNPWGVGPNYSFIWYDDGIGHHSQLLDDMARYGIFAIIFYGTILFEYCKYLHLEYKKLNSKYVSYTTTIIYICFLILNLGFRSAEESVLVWFIIPVIPKLLRFRKENYFLKEGE